MSKMRKESGLIIKKIKNSMDIDKILKDSGYENLNQKGKITLEEYNEMWD